MHPVDGEVATRVLGRRDELAAQFRPSRLRRSLHGGLDGLILGHPLGESFALQKIEHPHDHA